MTTGTWSLGLLAVGMAACSDPAPVPDPYAARTFELGTVTIEPHTEDLSKCVAVTLDNKDELFVNKVELVTGPGFHHSNWLHVPDHYIPGPDGIFNCDDRNYDQTAAGVLGGVFFAQSTQSEQEVQQFPDGVAMKIPTTSKLVAQIHLLNNSDEPLTLTPTIGYTPIPPETVTTRLASMTFEYHPLGLPPRKQSRFTVECDLAGDSTLKQFNDAPAFNVYYALAHYHEWATGMTIEAVKADGTSATIYSTEDNVGDVLGGMITPAFSMNGYTKVRLTCDYYNNTDATIYYGNGGGEMCIFNAFTDSPWMWAGGALDNGAPGQPSDVGGVATFTRACQVYAIEAEKF